VRDQEADILKNQTSRSEVQSRCASIERFNLGARLLLSREVEWL
jgi:hypothetical protein